MVKGRLFVIYIYNMRRSRVSAEEVLKAEKAKDDRRRSRANGFSKMRERDQGWTKLRNLNGSPVVMEWPVDREGEELEPVTKIPDGIFLLRINGETLVFDTEEFRRALRWA